jgi:hypothetical protein
VGLGYDARLFAIHFIVIITGGVGLTEVGDMDRDAALKLLEGGQQGVAEWNRRRQQDEEIPDLSGAKLSGAILSDANLSGTNLAVAVFTGADLGGADLNKSVCGWTTFADVDLSRTKGLDSVKHEGPSTIGTDTLLLSKGNIPEAFLRGCGLPDTMISYLPSLIGSMNPIQFYSCFISYSTKDEEFAKRLHSRMAQEKLRVWYAPDDMRAGREHDVQIDEAIRAFDKLLLVISEASMKSGWVRREIRRARQHESTDRPRKLFPIRLLSIDDVKAWESVDPRTGEDIAEELLRFHIPDFSNWKDHDAFEAAFKLLLRDLKAEEPGRLDPRST